MENQIDMKWKLGSKKKVCRSVSLHTPKMENQMEQKLEDEMETEVTEVSQDGIALVSPNCVCQPHDFEGLAVETTGR